MATELGIFDDMFGHFAEEKHLFLKRQLEHFQLYLKVVLMSNYSHSVVTKSKCNLKKGKAAKYIKVLSCFCRMYISIIYSWD